MWVLGMLRLGANEEGTHGRDQKTEAFGEGVREGKLLHFSLLFFFFPLFSLLLGNQWRGLTLRVG